MVQLLMFPRVCSFASVFLLNQVEKMQILKKFYKVTLQMWMKYLNWQVRRNVENSMVLKKSCQCHNKLFLLICLE